MRAAQNVYRIIPDGDGFLDLEVFDASGNWIGGGTVSAHPATELDWLVAVARHKFGARPMKFADCPQCANHPSCTLIRGCFNFDGRRNAAKSTP
jgi:allantoicase